MTYETVIKSITSMQYAVTVLHNYKI